MMTVQQLEAYGDAWNRHDIDAIMGYMAEDCVFLIASGPSAEGARYEGKEDVRRRFMEVWKDYPDVQFINAQHFVSGDRGLSQWTFVGTRASGRSLEVNGLDLFTFRDGKIWVKDSYLKYRK